MLGTRLVTPQTGPEGTLVRQVLIEEGLDIRREFYLGMVIDRSRERPVLMASTEGGMEIEEVAQTTPELILKEQVDPALGLQGFQGRNLAYGLGLEKKAVGRAAGFMKALSEAFAATDASLVEINPLVLTGDGDFYALDAKMNFDDNALYRHPELRELRDYHEEEPLEILAHRSGLNYIKLDGNVGCMVNGAGLAMATMDIIKLAGGNPANFLDVGGGASVRAGEDGVRDPDFRPQRPLRADQHFRWNHALRHAGRGRGPSRAGSGCRRSGGGAAGGDQRRAGPGDPPRLGSGFRSRVWYAGCSREGLSPGRRGGPVNGE